MILNPASTSRATRSSSRTCAASAGTGTGRLSGWSTVSRPGGTDDGESWTSTAPLDARAQGRDQGGRRRELFETTRTSGSATRSEAHQPNGRCSSSAGTSGRRRGGVVAFVDRWIVDSVKPEVDRPDAHASSPPSPPPRLLSSRRPWRLLSYEEMPSPMRHRLRRRRQRARRSREGLPVAGKMADDATGLVLVFSYPLPRPVDGALALLRPARTAGRRQPLPVAPWGTRRQPGRRRAADGDGEGEPADRLHRASLRQPGRPLRSREGRRDACLAVTRFQALFDSVSFRPGAVRHRAEWLVAMVPRTSTISGPAAESSPSGVQGAPTCQRSRRWAKAHPFRRSSRSPPSAAASTDDGGMATRPR